MDWLDDLYDPDFPVDNDDDYDIFKSNRPDTKPENWSDSDLEGDW